MKQAVILAAGLGTRLMPLTADKPKALVLCADKPLLAHAIEYLVSFGITRIVINVHYLGEQVIHYLNDYSIPGIEIFISDERDEIKETGGALVHALPDILPDEPLLIFNTDVVTNLDLRALEQYHSLQSNDATLIVQDRHSSRKLAFDANLQLRGWQQSTSGQIIGEVADDMTLLAFSGIHIIQPSLIRHFATTYGSKPFPVIPAYLAAATQYHIGGFVVAPDTVWLDTGTQERLKEAEQMVRGR